MRGSVPALALVILGLLAPACSLSAQPAPDAPSVQLQADTGAFAEEIRKLEAATDKAARRAAFADVLARAAKLKEPPEPLVAVLRNRKPEETFSELLAWIKDTHDARVKSFLPLLIVIASDSGEPAKPAAAALGEYGLEALDTLCAMLKGNDAAERNAAVVVAGKGIGGLRGAARVVPPLVRLVCDGPADVRAATVASLKKLTLLDLQGAEEWKAWLGQKAEIDLVAEIGDRERALNRQLRERVAELERKAQQQEIEALRDRASDPVALVERLRNAQYLGVQVKAAELLRALLPTLAEEAAGPAIDALGEALLDSRKPDELRIASAAALADAVAAPQAGAKAARAFAFIDRAVAENGVSAELRLALVRALNAPLAAQRLAAVLRAEIDEVHQRGGTQLEAAINQVVLVLASRDAGPDRDAILAEITRLLDAVSQKLAANNLAGPARTRYEGLGGKSADTLQNLARLREVDISPCVDALLRLAQVESAAAGSALTALRAAVNVPLSREELRGRLASPPESETLAALYARLTASPRETLLVNLLGLYEALGVAPEPLSELRRQLIDFARQSPAKLPPGPETRASRRDAVRALLARLAPGEEAHVAMVQDLFDCAFGDLDIVAYIQLLPSSRAALISKALRPKLAESGPRVLQLLGEIGRVLTQAERESGEHKALRSDAGEAARKDIAALVDAAIANGVDEERKVRLQSRAESLREQFVAATVEKLREKSTPSEGRDAVAELLLAVLRKAHQGNYDKTALANLQAREFEAAIDALKVQLRKDGYAV